MYTIEVAENGASPMDQMEEHLCSRRVEDVPSREQSRVYEMPVNCREQCALSADETNP
jgi:hypothetical protein